MDMPADLLILACTGALPLPTGAVIPALHFKENSLVMPEQFLEDWKEIRLIEMKSVYFILVSLIPTNYLWSKGVKMPRVCMGPAITGVLNCQGVYYWRSVRSGWLFITTCGPSCQARGKCTDACVGLAAASGDPPRTCARPALASLLGSKAKLSILAGSKTIPRCIDISCCPGSRNIGIRLYYITWSDPWV